MIAKPNVRFEDGEWLDKDRLNKAMEAVDASVEASNAAEQSAAGANQSAGNSAESAELSRQKAEQAARDLAAIKAYVDENQTVGQQGANIALLQKDVKDISDLIGMYSDRTPITLEAAQAGKAIVPIVDGSVYGKVGTHEGAVVSKEYTLTRGDMLLMKTGKTSNAIFTVSQVTTSADGNKTYTKVMSLNELAEVPTDGYLRFLVMPSDMTIVVTYFPSEPSFEATMRVKRCGAFASISTQVGNIYADLTNNYMRKDGYSAGARVGSADNLTSRGEATAEEFVSRIAGGSNSIEDGDARIVRVKGNTIVKDGTLVNMMVEGVRTTGRNLWDEEWEQGIINSTTGQKEERVNAIRSANYIFVKGGSKLFVRFSGGRIHQYDSNDNYLGNQELSGNAEITLPSNCSKIMIATYATYGTTYKNDICINLSDPAFNGQYEPYESHERKWTDTMNRCFPDGMKSAGEVFDELTPTKATARIGVEDMSKLNWFYDSSNKVFYTTNNFGLANSTNVVCGIYETSKNRYFSQAKDKTISTASGVVSGYIISLFVKDLAYNNAASFKEAMQGVMLYYELAEPIITEYDELNLSERVAVGGMEEAIVPEGVESAPLSADIIYPIDAYNTIKRNKANIEELGQKPAISLTADEVARLRALISTSTLSEGGER